MKEKPTTWVKCQNLIPVKVELITRAVSKTPVLIAYDKGIYRKYGLDVKLWLPPGEFPGAIETSGTMENPDISVDGGVPMVTAILANRDRLRPILMTVCTTTLGLVPMAIDKTEGANLWSPLALTVIGGIISSTLLTLMVTPAFYIISQDIFKFIRSFKDAGTYW